MAATPRNKIKRLYSVLQDHYKSDGEVLSKDRELIEHLVFATFLENSPLSAAHEAYNALDTYFIDWNEIRVSTAAELADTISAIPDPNRAAERVRRSLQWIFETTYKFDLEDWRKREISEFATFLSNIPFTTRFINDMVLHFACNQNLIPMDEGSMRVFRLLDLAEINSENVEVVLGLDRTFSRSDADRFFGLLHQLGVEMKQNPDAKKIKKLLKLVDPESDQRSWIPMVETDDDKDPSQIAKVFARQQIRRPKPPTLLDLDETDEPLDEFIEESAEEFVVDVALSFGCERDTAGKTGLLPDEPGIDKKVPAKDGGERKARKSEESKVEGIKTEPTSVPKPVPKPDITEKKSKVEPLPTKKTVSKPETAHEKTSAAKPDTPKKSDAKPGSVAKAPAVLTSKVLTPKKEVSPQNDAKSSAKVAKTDQANPPCGQSVSPAKKPVAAPVKETKAAQMPVKTSIKPSGKSPEKPAPAGTKTTKPAKASESKLVKVAKPTKPTKPVKPPTKKSR